MRDAGCRGLLEIPVMGCQTSMGHTELAICMHMYVYITI